MGFLQTGQAGLLKRYGKIFRLRFLLPGLLLLLLGWFLLPARLPDLEVRQPELKPSVAEKTVAPQLPELEKAPPTPLLTRKSGKVARGDSLSSLLADYLSPAQILALAEAAEPVFSFRRLRAGQPLIQLFEDQQWVGLIYEIDTEEQLEIGCRAENFSVELKPIIYDIENVLVHAAIDDSLYGAVEKAGESAELAWKMADVFAWDIDFMRDLRVGDSFRLLVEKRFRQGEFQGYGRLLAAQFVNQGESFQAAFFADAKGEGYYDSEGRSLRKNFLKAPLDYRRISSGFSRRRLHPVLNVYRPHLAIDYAAPTGTPVWAVADGVVTRRGYDRHSGNKLKLRHPNGYETLYIHLSRFARGLKVGSRVRQGQTIAYVGATGLATGPHLDFRVYKNGQAINPLKIHRSPTAPLTDDRLQAFKEKTDPLFAALSTPMQTARLEGN